MALSDELAKLAARAKETETRAAAAGTKARADLEQEVSSARAAAQAQGDKLRQKAADSQGVISDWWVDAQKSWNERIDAVREDIESKKTAHDVGKARWKADRAEEDAILRISEQLADDGHAACPVCAHRIDPGNPCESCGSELC